MTPDCGSRLSPGGSAGLTEKREMVPPALVGRLGWMAVSTVYSVGLVAYASAVGAGSRTVIVTTPVVLPPELVAVTVYAATGLTAEGVPLMMPVTGSRPRPAGSAGDTPYATAAPPAFEGTFGAMAMPRL